ncbi:MAG: YqaE/Pmp3 family membrane protein [Bacteroidota bacterium]|nr:YqaE/Pmp3 family membrane protein [Bacteroidota bacterium]
MKKTILNLSLIAILTLLFSSCGSISITQKRYSNGLNIDWFAGKDKKADNQNVVKKRKAKSNPIDNIASSSENATINNIQLNETIASENLNNENNINENQQPFNATFDTKQSQKKTLKTLKNATREDFNAISKEEKTEITKNLKSIKKKNNKNTTSNESGLPLILLVIIALIIPPLAVFLYYGEINVHFWINLILLLLVGGGLYTSIGVIGLGLAAIHALLVVFGLFN